MQKISQPSLKIFLILQHSCQMIKVFEVLRELFLKSSLITYFVRCEKFSTWKNFPHKREPFKDIFSLVALNFCAKIYEKWKIFDVFVKKFVH